MMSKHILLEKVKVGDHLVEVGDLVLEVMRLRQQMQKDVRCPCCGYEFDPSWERD